MKVRLRHRVEYGAFRSTIFVVNLMPEAIAYRVVAGVGRLFFRCSKRRQTVALRILRNAFPDQDESELLALGRRATGNIFKVGLDMMRLGPILRRGEIDERVELCGTLPTPPFIGTTMHLGSWEVAAAKIAATSGGADVVVQTFKNPLVQGFLERTRGACGLTLHPRRGGIRGLIKGLRAGGVGLQAIDQNQRLRGVFVPFFGELASTERAAATLALRENFPIIVGTCVRIGAGFRFQLHASPPIQIETSGDRDRDVETLVTRLNAEIESAARRFPEQYLWIHDRYKTRPPATS